MQNYKWIVCAVRLLALLAIALLISKGDASFAQKQSEVAQHGSTDEDPPAGGSISRISCGLESGPILAATRSSPFQMTSSSAPPPPSNTPVLGSQSTLFILVNFLDNPVTPISTADMYSAAFTDVRSINAFYTATSYGKIWLTGDVAGWFTIPYNEQGSCDTTAWAAAAKNAATQAGFNLANYSKFVYIWPQNNDSTGVRSTCPPGFAPLGGSDVYINAYVYPNGTFNANYPNPSIRGLDHLIAIVAHEMGHSFGVHHANSLRCSDGKITVGGMCTEFEYADFDDVMSSIGNVKEMNAPHRAALGWLDSSQIQDVSQDGIYMITPLEYNDSGVKALRITLPPLCAGCGPAGYYYLSYRLPVGLFDSYPAGIFANNGVSIHFWDHVSSNPTELLYASPWTAASRYGMRPSALLDGLRFEDRAVKLQVAQLSHDANGVTISIKFGRISCQSYSPRVIAPSMGLSGFVNANAGYYSGPFGVVVFNNNCVTCTASSFVLGSGGPDGWSTLYSGSTQSIPAQSYVLLNDQVRTSAGSTLGDYAFTVTATRTDAPAYSANTSGTVRITTTDVTPPTAPTNLIADADNTSISLSWTASIDNVGVTSYVIIRNDITVAGSAFFNTTSTSYLDIGTDPNHLYSYTAYARDAAGLQSRPAVVKASANVPVIDIVSPGDGATVSGTVLVAVDASANRGLTKVELYVDNRLTSTSTTPPFTTSWNVSRKVAAGNHSLQCKAYDGGGNVGNSAIVHVSK